jgi:hypothetical protein
MKNTIILTTILSRGSQGQATKLDRTTSLHCVKTKIYLFMTLTALCALSGCASIVSGTRQKIHVFSDPNAALVTVVNKQEETVATTTTPGFVILKRGPGSPQYRMTVKKSGYTEEAVLIEPDKKGNPWVFGNIIVGGLLGLAIDSNTGAANHLAPSEVKVHLAPVR